jgi:hypothetical protein
MRSFLLALSLTAVAGRALAAQDPRPDGPVLAARALSATGDVKMYVPAGSVRVIGWDHDSILVRGRVARGERFFFGGGGSGVKLGLDDRVNSSELARGDFVVYLPRQAHLSLKGVSASVVARDVSGWMYSVSGTLRISGSATSLDVQSMSGDVDIDVVTPWVRARTGSGRLLLRGAPQDADISTVSGALDIAASGLLRGQFASVSGDIRYAGAPARDAILDFSNHAGAVDLLMPPSASGRFQLSTVQGAIENGFAPLRPATSPPRSLSLVLGRGDAQVTVRTFKGPIRMRVQ